MRIEGLVRSDQSSMRRSSEEEAHIRDLRCKLAGEKIPMREVASILVILGYYAFSLVDCE